MKKILAALVLLSVVAVAQTPIDPLRRPEEAPGEYTWRITLGYTPAGREGLAVDPLGQPYAFTVLSHEWRLGLTGTVHFGGGWKTGVEMFQITTTVHELRRYPWGEERHTTAERKMTYSLFQEWRMDPKNPWDPRVSVAFGHPWKAGVVVAGSFRGIPWCLWGRPD